MDKEGQLGDWERVRGTDMKATELVDISDFGRCVCVKCQGRVEELVILQ